MQNNLGAAQSRRDDRIFYRGQPIAAVIAETLEQAQHAASIVKVRYETAPHKTDLRSHLGDYSVSASRRHGTSRDPTSAFDTRVVAPVTKTTRKLYACPNCSTTYRLVNLNLPGPFTMRGPG